MKRVLSLLLAGVAAILLLTGCSSNQKEFAILDETLADEFYVVGFRKADLALRDEVQKQLVALKQDGTLAEISKKWFSEDKITVPDTFTPSENATDDSLQKVLDKKTLVMGLDDSFPPMGFRDDAGNLQGFDIDVAKQVCQKMGVELVLQPISWSAKDQELNGGNIDCIWNGFSYDEDRAAAMALTEPYMTNRQVVVTLKESNIQSLADLSGKTVAIQQGSTAELAIDGVPTVKDSLKEVVKVANNVLALNDLGKSGCDAVVMDEVVARYYVSRQEQLQKDAENADG